MWARYGPQFSQLPRLQPRCSVSCRIPTVHPQQACAFNPPVALRSVCCTSSFIFTSPPWPELTAGQAEPVSCQAQGTIQGLGEQGKSTMGAGFKSAWGLVVQLSCRVSGLSQAWVHGLNLLSAHCPASSLSQGWALKSNHPQGEPAAVREFLIKQL